MEFIKKNWMWLLLSLIILGGVIYYFVTKDKIDGVNSKRKKLKNEESCKADLDDMLKIKAASRFSSCDRPSLEKMNCPKGGMDYEPTCEYEVSILRAKGWS